MGSVSPDQFRILMGLVSSGEAFTNGESGLSERCLPARRLFVVFFCRRATAARSLNFLEIPSQSGFLGLCYEYGKILPYSLGCSLSVFENGLPGERIAGAIVFSPRQFIPDITERNCSRESMLLHRIRLVKHRVDCRDGVFLADAVG